MNSETNIVAQSAPRLFSAHPILHYFLAISIACIAVSFFFSFRAYGCLYSGSDYECISDPNAPVMIAQGPFVPNVPSILLATLRISTDHFLFCIKFFVITCAPVYALAHYVGRRCAVHRNAAGIAFWIMAWILAFLPFPVAIEIEALTTRGRSWGAELSEFYLFVVWGSLCGVVYCALAFLHREKTVES